MCIAGVLLLWSPVAVLGWGGCLSTGDVCLGAGDVVSLWGRIYTGLKIVSLSHQIQSYTMVPIIGGVQMIVTVRAGGPTPHVCATVGPYASLVPRNHQVGP